MEESANDGESGSISVFGKGDGIREGGINEAGSAANRTEGSGIAASDSNNVDAFKEGETSESEKSRGSAALSTLTRGRGRSDGGPTIGDDSSSLVIVASKGAPDTGESGVATSPFIELVEDNGNALSNAIMIIGI